MSIRLRLTLLYSTLLTIVLIIFSILLYSAFALSLRAEFDVELDNMRDQIIANTARVPGGVFMPQLDEFSSKGFYLQRLALDGSVQRRTENLGDQALPNDAELLGEARVNPAHTTIRLEGFGALRLLTAPLDVNRIRIGYIQIARPLQPLERTLDRLAITLIASSSAAIALSALIGFWLAGSALHPIDHITRAARAITRTTDLSQRVHQTHKGDEVDRLAITFNEMLSQLESQFRNQQRFVADASHELRTPLTIIRGQLALLQKSSSSTDHEAISAIDDEAQRMTRLISDLLLLAQSDAGAATLKRDLVELDTLMLDVYRQARIMVNGRSENLKVTLGAEDQALIEGDADRLKQLLLNLIENAIKYTPSGEIKLSLHKHNGEVAVSVSDTGPGIPPADLPHIFERFYRVDKARSREQGGTGLGLSIAQWIAQAHSGRIDVQSTPGKGTTFTVWLKEKV